MRSYASQPVARLQSWAEFNGITLNNISVAENIPSKDGEVDKGAGLLATARIAGGSESPDVLLAVPPDLVLSKTAVHLWSKADLDLGDIISAVGDFAETPRTAILIFLLFQLAHSSPDLAAQPRGVKSPFTDYVEFLPKMILLPTFYTDKDRDLLIGTSLRDALDQKLASLAVEFQSLREATSHIGWCQKHWWDDEDGVVTLADWKLVDAIYRSRALDLPGIGHAMVPVLDMANHVSDNKRNARFEVGGDGSVLLVREDGAIIEEGEEVNITYGAGGACETIFSYGFLDDGAQSARELFLSMNIPLDDPLRTAKKAAAKEPPGVRLFTDSEGLVQWEGALVWWAAVNEEDGLDFQVTQSHDGTRELQTLWKNEEFQSSKFYAKIVIDENFDIFRLRTTVMVQDRVEAQIAELVRSEGDFEEASLRVEPNLRVVLKTLRTLELELLVSVHEALEKQKSELLDSDTVVRYLSTAATNHHEECTIPGDMEDDFS